MRSDCAAGKRSRKDNGITKVIAFIKSKKAEDSIVVSQLLDLVSVIELHVLLAYPAVEGYPRVRGSALGVLGLS